MNRHPMGTRFPEKRGIPAGVVVWAVIVPLLAAAIWGGVTVSDSIEPHRFVKGLLDGFAVVLTVAGTIAVSMGTLAFVIEAAGRRRTECLLHCVLLALVGLAVYAKNGWAIVGAVLAGAVVVLHEYLSRKGPQDPAE